MPSQYEVGVVIARRTLAGPWGGTVWAPRAVLPGRPAAAPGTPIGRDTDGDLFFAGASVLTLVAGATAHYRDNLASGRPSLWVALRADASDPDTIRVTADPYEGEALTDGLGDIVEAVSMPPPIQRAVAAFVEAFHVERPFVKRRRERWHRPQVRRPYAADGPETG